MGARFRVLGVLPALSPPPRDRRSATESATPVANRCCVRGCAYVCIGGWCCHTAGHGVGDACITDVRTFAVKVGVVWRCRRPARRARQSRCCLSQLVVHACACVCMFALWVREWGAAARTGARPQSLRPMCVGCMCIGGLVVSGWGARSISRCNAPITVCVTPQTVSVFTTTHRPSS